MGPHTQCNTSWKEEKKSTSLISFLISTYLDVNFAFESINMPNKIFLINHPWQIKAEYVLRGCLLCDDLDEWMKRKKTDEKHHQQSWCQRKILQAKKAVFKVFLHELQRCHMGCCPSWGGYLPSRKGGCYTWSLASLPTRSCSLQSWEQMGSQWKPWERDGKSLYKVSSLYLSSTLLSLLSPRWV